MSSKKSTANSSRAVLQELQKKPGNKTCADCGAKQPTWASTNIGVFVCIRCSGMHRNMGTHISKVKSATLDIWPMDLVKHFKNQGGNVKVNAIYEAKLPRGAKPNAQSDMYLIKRFIEDKYQRKLWWSPKKAKAASKKRSKKAESSTESSSESSSDDDEETTTGTPTAETPKKKKKKKEKKINKPKSGRKTKKAPPKVDKPPSSRKTAQPAPVEAVPDLLDVSTLTTNEPAKKTGFDSTSFVDDLLSATPAAPAEQKQSDNIFGSAPAPATAAADGKTTNDILSLFSKGPAQQPKPDPFRSAGPGQPMNSMGMMGAASPMMGQPNRMMGQPNPMMRPAAPQMMAQAQPFGMMAPQQRSFPPMQQNMGFQPFGQPAPPQMAAPVQPQRNFMTAVNPAAQSRYLGVAPQRPGPSPFSNPAPLQSSAFDTLMLGNQPKKDHKVYKQPTSAYIAAKKNANDGLKIDLSSWMKKQ